MTQAAAHSGTVAHEPMPASRAVPIAYVARGGAIDGAGRQLLYLLEHVDRSRFDPLVLLDASGPLVDAIEALAIAVRVTPMRPWRSLRGLPFRRRDAAAAMRLARAHGAAIVHCSDTWRTPYAASVATALGIPLVTHVRGPTTQRDLAKNFCLRADAILAIADRYRADIVAAGYSSARIIVVNDAVDAVKYATDPRAGRAFRDEHALGRSLVVGLLGRIEPFKRIVEFVDVIANVPERIDATCVLVGETRRRSYVREVERRIASGGLVGRVRFVERRDDVPAVLSGLDVLATMSGGSVMFEAMACGVPVFSVRADGRHSQHTRQDETAWCVTTDDPRTAADAIVTLLDDAALRRRLATAGRDYVLDRLAPATMARETEDVYERVLAARSAAASAAS